MDQDELFNIFLVSILTWLYLYEQIKEILAYQKKKKKEKKEKSHLLKSLLYSVFTCGMYLMRVTPILIYEK